LAKKKRFETQKVKKSHAEEEWEAESGDGMERWKGFWFCDLELPKLNGKDIEREP